MDTQFANVLRALNGAESADELVKTLQLPADAAANVLAQRAASGGVFTKAAQVQSVLTASQIAFLYWIR